MTRPLLTTCRNLLLAAILPLASCEPISVWDDDDESDATSTNAASSQATTSTETTETETETTETEDSLDTSTFDTSLGTEIDRTDGGGGFVNNPDSSRGTLKVVWPSAYSDRIYEVHAYTSDGQHYDTLYNAKPNEYGDRERYYGSYDISVYPDNLIVRAILNTGWSIYVILPDPQTRYD